jgi:hypothetical protein
VKLFGFRILRYKEWANVLREEFGQATWKDKVRLCYTMVKTVAGGRVEPRKSFIRKMRVCRGCVLFDSVLRRCRPYSGSRVGCGCYMPFKAAIGGKCWLDEHYPEDRKGWND